jgi:hypothetical protein
MTADPTLSARLASLKIHHTDEYIREIQRAYNAKELITLADHEAAAKAAVDAREDEILDMINAKFSGALHLRDEARKVKDTQGAAIHNEAVQTLADMRAAIRARANGGE